MEAARPATGDDAGRLQDLAAAAVAELGAQERGGRVFTTKEVGGQLEQPCVVVGTLDGETIGFGTGRVETLRDGERLGVVDYLYVEPDARGVGVGEAMLGSLLSWFRTEGCSAVDAYALPGMRETKNFFETFGFTARLLVVNHKLGPELPSESVPEAELPEAVPDAQTSESPEVAGSGDA